MSRHQCIIYEGSPSRHLPIVAAIMVEKLKANRRCLYLNSPPMVTGLRSYLAAAGIDTATEIEKGSLILSSDDGHLDKGLFEVNRMLGLLRDAVDQATTEGYAGLWASGDMAWEFGVKKDFAKLLEYEYGLEALFHDCPRLEGICQYHAQTLPSFAMRQGLQAHQTVYVNETLYRLNPNCVPLAARDATDLSTCNWEEMLDYLCRSEDPLGWRRE